MLVHVLVESSSGSEWEDVDEEDAVSVTCLFCFEHTLRPDALFKHCLEKHEIDIVKLIRKHGLGQYDCLKMVNFIRKQHISPMDLVKMATIRPFPWEDDINLKPVIEDDPLLQYDFEGLLSEDDSTAPAAQLTADQYKEALSHALEELQIMKARVKELLAVDAAVTSAPQSKPQPQEEEEEGYYSSYTHFGIHEEMLKDKIRTETYREFIFQNKHLFRDKIVLDVGCGTGILSMFAAQAGAAVVYAVDNSEVIYKAMDIVREFGFHALRHQGATMLQRLEYLKLVKLFVRISVEFIDEYVIHIVRENKLQHKVILVKGEIEQLELPVDKVDVIISEWMGYFLLFESMLDTVAYARDKWLNDRSYVYPDGCSISVAAVSCSEYWSNRVDYWNDVYGFKMSCMRNDMLKEAAVMYVDPDWIISSHSLLKKFNVTSVQVSQLNFKTTFTLAITRTDICHAIVGYFDVSFMAHCTNPFYFSSGPMEEPTHWKQTLFHLHEPIAVTTGDMLSGNFSCGKLKGDKRSLDITMEIQHFTGNNTTPSHANTYHYIIQ